jgi:hypothetical protein
MAAGLTMPRIVRHHATTDCGDAESAILLPSRKEGLEPLGYLLVTLRDPSGVVEQFFPSSENRRLPLKKFLGKSLAVSVDRPFSRTLNLPIPHPVSAAD